MKEDENKNTEAAAEQPETLESVETVETPDTESAPGDDVQGPSDSEGCESVTVVIIAHDERQGNLIGLSVKRT